MATTTMHAHAQAQRERRTDPLTRTDPEGMAGFWMAMVIPVSIFATAAAVTLIQM